MAAVEGSRVAGEEAAHAPGYGARAGAHQEVGVVREEGPVADGSGVLLRQPGQAGDKGRAAASSRTMTRRSTPRTMTWWRVLGASRRRWRGTARGTATHIVILGNGSPDFRARCIALFGSRGGLHLDTEETAGSRYTTTNG